MTSIFRRSLLSQRSLLRELNKTYGLSFFKSNQLLKKYGIHKNSKVQEISWDILENLSRAVEINFLADVDLKKAHLAKTHQVAGLKNHHALFLRMLLKKNKQDAK